MENNRTLNIKSPFGGVLITAALLFSSLLGITEVIFRSLIAANVLPIPYFSTGNPEFNIKMQALDRMAARGEKIDCIFIGSSQFDNGVNPQVFQQVFLQETNTPIQCYNFSLATLTAAPAGKLTQILSKRYHPDLIIYGTSARDYSEEFGELTRPLLEDPWVQFQIGQFNLRGALLEVSYAFRWLVSFDQMQDKEYRQYFTKTHQSITEDGMAPRDDNDFKESDGVAIPGFTFSSTDLAGLDQIIALKNQGIEVIIVEMPVHLQFVPHYVGDTEESYTQEFLAPIEQHVQNQGVAFWRTTYTINSLIPQEDWYDLKHLNKQGADRFSRWLAEKLSEAILSGRMENPFQ